MLYIVNPTLTLDTCILDIAEDEVVGAEDGLSDIVVTGLAAIGGKLLDEIAEGES